MALITEQLAEFVAMARPQDLPENVLDRAVLSTLDCIAAAIGGVPTANAASMRAAATRIFGGGPARAWFTDSLSMPAAAILANCAAASALDVDDGHRGASGHAGAAVVPAVLTAAAHETWSGVKLLTAIALGYDVALRVASARQPGTVTSFAAGLWCGYGVAAAISYLYGLGPAEIAHAIAIAGAEAPQNLPQGACCMSSVKGSSPWGTMTAYVAVERARYGATGSIDLLDRESVFDQGKILDGLGQRWLINETYLKPYASCRYTHAAIDAVLELVNEGQGTSAPVDELIVEIFPEGLTITNDREPKTLEAAQFSIPFSVALAALRGARALRPLTEASLHDEEVLALSRRLKFYPVTEFAGAFPKLTPSRVRVRRGGVESARTVLHPLGEVDNPLRQSDIEAKFADLARGFIPGDVVSSTVKGCVELKTGSPKRLLAALDVPAFRTIAGAAQ
jgi:2-methylcitrate dehydratase PrpD